MTLHAQNHQPRADGREPTHTNRHADAERHTSKPKADRTGQKHTSENSGQTLDNARATCTRRQPPRKHSAHREAATRRAAKRASRTRRVRCEGSRRAHRPRITLALTLPSERLPPRSVHTCCEVRTKTISYRRLSPTLREDLLPRGVEH